MGAILVVVDEGRSTAEEGLGTVLGGGDEVREERRRSAGRTIGLSVEELSVGLEVGDDPAVGDAAIAAPGARGDGRPVVVVDGPPVVVSVVVVLETQGAGQGLDVRATRLNDVLDAPVRL